MDPRKTIVAGLAGLCVACAGDRAATSVQVLDSAGIRVVNNLPGDLPEWRLSGQPILDLGSVDAEGPDQFFRVVAGHRLGDGRIVVSDGGSGELRVFTGGGAYVRSIGRSGEGPGEFSFPGRLWVLRDDSILVWDARLRRLSVFDSTGGFARSVALKGAIANPAPLAATLDARVVFTDDRFDFSHGESFRMMYTDYFLVDQHGEVVRRLPQQPLGQYGALRGTGLIGTPLFGTRTVSAGDSTGYWVGTGDKEEIRRYSIEGELKIISRWPSPDRSVRAEDEQLALQDQLANASEGARPRIRQIHAARPVADRFPSLEFLQPGPPGWVWIREYARPGRQGSPAWRVVEPNGVMVARVSMPADLRILEVGNEYVLAVGRDEFDVEHVQLFQLIHGVDRH